MKNNKQLANFNGQAIEVINKDGDGWMTGEQIGDALGYENPLKAINNLFQRNREELEEYSCTLKLRVHDHDGRNVQREVRLFNEEGVMLICMFSQQPSAGVSQMGGANLKSLSSQSVTAPKPCGKQ